MEVQDSLSVGWAKFEGLSTCLIRYLRTSEEEFGSLIQALDACWNMAENVQKATSRLTELTGAASGSQAAAVRQSMLDGCGVLRKSLNQIQEVRRQLASAMRETEELVGTASHLLENLAPLRYIAFHFRLEGSRLSPEDSATVLKLYEEMQGVVSRMKQAGDAQERTLVRVLDKLSATTRSIEQVTASYTTRANESQERIERNLDLLSQVPPDLMEVQQKASSLATVVADGIREAVKALQGHDAIRQRLENVLAALANVRKDQGNESGHALLLQRQQAKCVLELIVDTGSRIERELHGVIGCAQGIASDSHTRAFVDDEVKKFETAVDHLASLSAEVAGLLAGQVKIGNFVLAQVGPIRELLSAHSSELEALARSMKKLAFNVLIGAEKMPSARGIGALGTWTSEAAERVLKLERELNEQCGRLGATLQSQAAAITTDMQGVESCWGGFMVHRSNDSLRNSRRIEYDEVTRLSQEAHRLQEKTETLVQSLRFVDEGIGLLGDLDVTLDFLLALYPKSEKPFDLDSASAGYTMQEQRDVHAMVSGEEAEDARAPLAEPAEGQEFGENIELF
jgi:hypothetical protein